MIPETVLSVETVARYRRFYDLDKVLADENHTGIEWECASIIQGLANSHEQLRADLAVARSLLTDDHLRALREAVSEIEWFAGRKEADLRETYRLATEALAMLARGEP